MRVCATCICPCVSPRLIYPRAPEGGAYLMINRDNLNNNFYCDPSSDPP